MAKNLFICQNAFFADIEKPARHDKIECSEDPKCNPLGGSRSCKTVGMQERGSHGVDMYEGVRAPCIRDEIREVTPCVRYHLFGPRDTCHKEEYERRRDEQNESRFAVSDEDGDAEREENDCQQIGHDQQQDIVYCAYVRDSE